MSESSENLPVPIKLSKNEGGLSKVVQGIKKFWKEKIQPESLYDQVFRKFTEGVRVYGYQRVNTGIAPEIIPQITEQHVVYKSGNKKYQILFLIHDTAMERNRVQNVMLNIRSMSIREVGEIHEEDKVAVINAMKSTLLPDAPPRICPYGVDPTGKLEVETGVYKSLDILGKKIGRKETNGFLKELLSAKIDEEETRLQFLEDETDYKSSANTISFGWISPENHQQVLKEAY